MNFKFKNQLVTLSAEADQVGFYQGATIELALNGMVEAALLQSHNLTELDGFETFQQGTVDLQLQGRVEFYYIIIQKGKDKNFEEFETVDKKDVPKL